MPEDADTRTVLEQTLVRYEDELLREVAHRLVKPRGRWLVDALREKIITTLANPTMISRRIKELPPAQRLLLKLIAMSRRPRWPFGGLLEMLRRIIPEDGKGHVHELLKTGLLFPVLRGEHARVSRLDQPMSRRDELFIPERVAACALQFDDCLPVSEPEIHAVSGIRETDGLELFLRLGVLWQQVHDLPLRLAQSGSFYKKDHDRLNEDPLLAGPSADELQPVPGLGNLLVELGIKLGILHKEDNEVRAGSFPATWNDDPLQAARELWAVLPEIKAWDSAEPLLALAGLAGWKKVPVPFSGGVAYQLRLVQAATAENGDTVVRLSDWGKAVQGVAPAPPATPFPKTLMVQPNHEIIAYRQGLTPRLIARLSSFGNWTSLSTACTLRIQPETIYRGLEAGMSCAQMLQTLQQHGVRETPETLVHSIKTWADKRDRISVYANAVIIEFTSPEELTEALSRGLQGEPITDRLVLAASEDAIDYRHYRLIGTRDYGLPPERCVEVQPDGVTVSVDLARTDLLLNAELERFAEALPAASENGRRTYQLTPSSLSRWRTAQGGIHNMEMWFMERTGAEIPPAVRLFLATEDIPPLALKRLTVLEVPSKTLADGLMQWPETRALIQARLGPTVLAVDEQNQAALQSKLGELRLKLHAEPRTNIDQAHHE